MAGDFYICTMRYLFFTTLLFIIACTSGKKKGKDTRSQVAGNWFVVYPDEKLNSQEERELYARLQDSLVNQRGVKLVTFDENGTFTQWDSTGQQGRWGILEDGRVVVNRAGRGFENFKADFDGISDDEMMLTEYIKSGTERLKLTWHLARINGGTFARLFKPEENTWRKVPAKPETEAEMRTRLAAMLSYYADYFRLISEEASYFVPARVMMPLRFYQHAIGMMEMSETHRFVSLFSSFAEAQKAYDMLKEVVNDADIDLPDDDSNSYSKEYALMLDVLSKDMSGK